MPIDITQLFLWSHFWGLFSLGAFTFLSFLLGYIVGKRRGERAAEAQHRERVLHLAVAHLLGEDIFDD